MPSRRTSFGLLAVALAVVAWLAWPGRTIRPPVELQKKPVARALAVSTAPAPDAVVPSLPATVASMQADFPLAAPLNAPGSTLSRDLDVVQAILEAWRSNFPRDGNPVGDNHEITAALTGENRLQLVLIPKNHPALNGRGELCDRWDTPFHFHQISGDRMEIASAGPDRKFGTADDALGSPGGDAVLR